MPLRLFHPVLHPRRIVIPSGAARHQDAVIPSKSRPAGRVEGPPPSLLLALALLVLATVPLHAQVESNLPGAGFGPDDATPTIHVYSRETVIDVLATDAKGQPVTGLTRDDFTIQEDGRAQPIRSFREYSVTDAPLPPRALPPHTWTNAQALPTIGPVQIFYFILPPPIEVNTSMELRADPSITAGAIIVRAKQYIADYFRTMPAGTQVAIFTFAPGEGLHLVQGFTTDGTRAAAALDTLVVQRIRTPNPVVSDPIAAANQIVDYVAGIHGRKNLIWIAPGSPPMITRDGGYADPCGAGPPDMKQVHRLMDIYDRFTQKEIAIYPLDPNGLHGLGCQQLRSEMIAEQSGGATSNTNDYKGAVATIVDSTRHFYTLSYVPTRPDSDGHFHPIAIKVSRPGVHLAYRTGYNDEQPRPPDAVIAQHMLQAPMRLGSLPSTQLLFDLELQPTPASNAAGYAAAEAALNTAKRSGKPSRPGKGMPYDVVFRFDPTQIAFAEEADGNRTANIQFDLGAYSPYGDLGPVRIQTVKITLTPVEYDEFMKTPYRFYLPIPLSPGQLTLRAGVFDNVAHTSGTLEVPLTVPKVVKP